MSKVTVMGAGNVGASVTNVLAYITHCKRNSSRRYSRRSGRRKSIGYLVEAP